MNHDFKLVPEGVVEDLYQETLALLEKNGDLHAVSEVAEEAE